MSNDTLKQMALDYHRNPVAGKLSILPSKPLGNQRNLALAYFPGVAAACEAIAEDPAEVATLTARQNLVAVITNGTAVLGLGAIGPLASKPVMEGKAFLFKKFAGIDVFDIELDATEPEKMVDIITSLEPTFGAINLEDIKAPECFIVEQQCRERMNIPVFHDDQHGTAIVAAAAILNGLRLVGKRFGDIKLVSTGGGAAGIACLNLLVGMGVKRENVTLVDRLGVVHVGRNEEMDIYKEAYAQDTDARELDEVIDGADVFLGLSAPGILTGDMVKRMADKPLIMALANPVPEIEPDEASAAAPDAIIATGRSDFPNQVNNVLCFPFIFRGALDVGATTINEEIKKGGGQGDRRIGDGGKFGSRRHGVSERRSEVRSGLRDPETIRFAFDRRDRPRRGEGGHGFRCRHPADRGFRSVSEPAGAVRFLLRHAHEARDRTGADGAAKACLRRG